MERSLGLMAGAGILPGRAAAEAGDRGGASSRSPSRRRPAWPTPPTRVVPSTITDIQAVLVGARRASACRRPSSSASSGSRAPSRRRRRPTPPAARLARGGLSDDALAAGGGRDARGHGHRGPRPAAPSSRRGCCRAGTLDARAPTAAEWDEIRAGFALARPARRPTASARRWCGRAGVTVARGGHRGHRRDDPARRPSGGPGRGGGQGGGRRPRLSASTSPPSGRPRSRRWREGGATALAVAAGRVLLVDRDEVVRLADAGGHRGGERR